jgi:hypothetical protein
MSPAEHAGVRRRTCWPRRLSSGEIVMPMDAHIVTASKG